MFLKKVIEKNKLLVETAIKLHQTGKIPPNCFVFDLDAVENNAVEIVKEAEKYNLKMYLMTKHFNRNPFVTAIAIAKGFKGVVAVNFQGAAVHRRFDIPVKHIGHLCQTPKNYIIKALDLNPEVITVFSDIEAELISEASRTLGRKQDILLRIVGEKDTFFYGQEGGILENELEEIAGRVMKLSNVKIIGVTSFPCLNYATRKGEEVYPTNNLKTIVKAAGFLQKKFGINIKQINAPGNNFIEVFKLLSDAGATHIEPGQALLGTTPQHAFENIKGIPSYVYISEISHIINNKGYAFGGGLWQGIEIKDNLTNAIVGSNFEEGVNNILDIENFGQGQVIDYHIIISQGEKCRIGDSVISCSYVQMQETNSYIAPVSGIHSNCPRVKAIFDNGCHPVGNNSSIDFIKKCISDLLNRN